MIMMKKSDADKHKKKLNNAGFSLVEVLVAMAVLAILSIPVLSSFSNAARINHKARKEENANTVASDIVEQFKSVSMSEILSQYKDKYTEGTDGKYIFTEERTGANGEKYKVVTELEPGRYKAGDDEDNNYNNNINSYVNSVKNFVLREELYSYDIEAEKKFMEEYQAGYDKKNITKVTNINVEVKHSESGEYAPKATASADTKATSAAGGTEAASGEVENYDGIDAYYQRVTLSFEYRYNNNEADVYKPDPVVYPNNYFRAAASGTNAYRISTTLSNNLKDVYIFYAPYDTHSETTVEGDGSKYYSSDKINISYNYSNESYVKYDGCNVFIIQQTTRYDGNNLIKMALNRANVKLKVNGTDMDLATKGTVSLGTTGNGGVSGSTASGPVSIFSNIYNWGLYKDPNNTGAGNNGISSKSLLYTMTVKVYYQDETEPMAQVVTTKIG